MCAGNMRALAEAAGMVVALAAAAGAFAVGVVAPGCPLGGRLSARALPAGCLGGGTRRCRSEIARGASGASTLRMPSPPAPADVKCH